MSQILTKDPAYTGLYSPPSPQYPAGRDVRRPKGWRAWRPWCVLSRKPLIPSPPLSRELFQHGSVGASWGMAQRSLNLGMTSIWEKTLIYVFIQYTSYLNEVKFIVMIVLKKHLQCSIDTYQKFIVFQTTLSDRYFNTTTKTVRQI